MDPRLAERMTEHVLDIAREAGVRVTWVRRWQHAESVPALSQVAVPEIRHPYDYLFALHELGHVLSPDARVFDDDTDVYSVLLCEGAAWAWAAAHARPALVRHLRASDWTVISRGYRSYLAWGGSRKAYPFEIEVPVPVPVPALQPGLSDPANLDSGASNPSLGASPRARRRAHATLPSSEATRPSAP